MINIQEVTKDIYWIGGSDRRLALFENLFPLPKGVSYNSYIVLDEKTAVFDTADISISDQYLENLKTALAGRPLDYLVVLHMEPDHCSQIATVAAMYPELTLIGNVKTFQMMKNYFPETADMKKIVVKEGDTFTTGAHTFAFVMAPMVHWPEAMFAYDTATGALFSAAKNAGHIVVGIAPCNFRMLFLIDPLDLDRIIGRVLSAKLLDRFPCLPAVGTARQSKNDQLLLHVVSSILCSAPAETRRRSAQKRQILLLHTITQKALKRNPRV